MSRAHSPAPRMRTSIALRLGLGLGLVIAGVLSGTGCSVNASFQAGTTAGSGKTREARPSHSAANDDDAAARERTRKRRAKEDMERIDREARERVAQAERDAAEKERAAEADAERERQQAAADAEQRKREAAEAAAKADKAQKPMQRRQSTGRFDMGTQGGTGGAEDEVFQRRSTEINQSADEKKAAIRKQLEQNKSDILVAAERKRTAVQESLKDKPEKQP